jgi:DNA-binding response OmpR family regulator
MQKSSSPHTNILLLDSDPITRTVLRDTLQHAGYVVFAAGDLGEAVDRLTEVRPDLLITRPYINSMPGHTAAEYLRNKCLGLPVLIVAGFMDDDRVNVQNTIAGFYTFPKPFLGEELLDKVKSLLDAIYP